MHILRSETHYFKGAHALVAVCRKTDMQPGWLKEQELLSSVGLVLEKMQIGLKAKFGGAEILPLDHIPLSVMDGTRNVADRISGCIYSWNMVALTVHSGWCM